MHKPGSLSVEAKHRMGEGDRAFCLDVAFRIDRWPAVLFGPSGAGKSTLLRIIAGLQRARTLHIALGDRSLRGAGPGWPTGTVQMVSQRPALFPHLDAAGNVAFGLREFSRTERRARVDEMLHLLGAEHLAQSDVAALSGGEQQRIAIARALAPGPQLLLLDEAFSGLDAGAKHDIRERLQPLLHERGIASLYVTHEVGDAFALDPEVVVLQAGRIVAQGPAYQALAAERERLLTLLERPAPVSQQAWSGRLP